ncbi:MAG: hypothetical protein V1934_01020 [Methanobacteriota archaeon]
MNTQLSMYVEEEDAQKAVCRFGNLKIPRGLFSMPTISPGIQKNLDVEALMANISGGSFPHAITPHLSTKQRYIVKLMPMLPSGKGVIHPFVVPDPEYEALSVNCLARLNYMQFENPPPTVRMIMDSGLTDDPDTDRFNVTTRWQTIRQRYGLAPLLDWSLNLHDSINSDLYLAPTPIMRADEKLKSIEEAFTSGYFLLSNAVSSARFALNGIHTLLHIEIFSDTDEADAARNKILTEFESWKSEKQQYRGSIVGIKLYDPNNLFGEADSGSVRRRLFSEFVTELSSKVRGADGFVIGYNFANLSLGILDSGADLATFKVAGGMRIDVPIKSSKGKRGKRRIPSVFDGSTLSEVGSDIIKQTYNKYGSFPVPACMQPKPYWDENYKEASIYARRTRCASLIAVGEEYRAAALDNAIPLKDSLRNRIMQSEARQELIDLCPTING